MTEKDQNREMESKEKDMDLEKDIDQEALNVIFRLYDETFKELVER